MLKIIDLCVTVGEKKILKNFNIEIKEGEIHAIMGPNGTGKSTLSKVIMGNKNYHVESGTMLFNGTVLNDLPTDERARLGLFLSMQNPISIEGVTNSEFLKTAVNARRENAIGLYEFMKSVGQASRDLEMKEEMVHRSINVGASGGERKKNEVLQIKLLKPTMIILDELDSGLDVDSLKIVCQNLNQYLKENPKTSLLIITHYPRILEYLHPDYVHMMVDGKVVKTGDYQFALEIEKNGYSLPFSDTFNISENEIYE